MNDYLQRGSASPVRTVAELGQDPACYRTAGTPSVSSGYHQIPPIRRRTVIIPNSRKTSYSLSYSRDYGEHSKRQSLVKQLLGQRPHCLQSWDSTPSHKLESRAKRLTALCDLLADSCVQRKVSSPGALPVALRLGDGRQSVTPMGKYSTKATSKGNGEWLDRHAEQTLLQRVACGEVVPNTQQLCLYGRRPAASRFYQRHLWQAYSAN